MTRYMKILAIFASNVIIAACSLPKAFDGSILMWGETVFYNENDYDYGG